MFRKLGKIGKINLDANRKLKEIYLAKGITECEIRLPMCCINWALGFAHRHKRWKYIKCPEKLSEFKETILACTSCHQKIEGNRELTDKIFKRLRP